MSPKNCIIQTAGVRSGLLVRIANFFANSLSHYLYWSWIGTFLYSVALVGLCWAVLDLGGVEFRRIGFIWCTTTERSAEYVLSNAT